MSDTKSKLAFVVAHYHAQGKVPTNLYNLVRHLAELSNNIVFVSTNICESDVIKISPFAKVIARENFGYDFWSYKVGLESLEGLEEIERLVFLNSSFITTDPQALCQLFLEPVNGKTLRGLTACRSPKQHIQSYLFSFEDNSLINSEDFKTWWRNMTPLSNRDEVIAHYEIGMSSWFSSKGIPIKSTFVIPKAAIVKVLCSLTTKRNWKPSDFFTVLKLLKIRLISKVKIYENLNPTHLFWDSLYQKAKIIKIDLLKNNPTNQDLNKLLSKLDQKSLNLIKDAIS